MNALQSVMQSNKGLLVGGLQTTHSVLSEFESLLDNLIVSQCSYKESLFRLLSTEPDHQKPRHTLYIVYLATAMVTRVRDLRARHAVVSDAEFLQFMWEVARYVDVKNYLQGYQAPLRHWGKVFTEYVTRVLSMHNPGTPEGVLAIKQCYVLVRNYYEKVTDGESSSLTPAHPLLVQVALALNHPELVLPLIETTIFGMDPHRSGVQLTEYLAYYYYAGAVFASLKKWPQAIAAWESCLSIPKMTVTHAYTFAAASRYLLAQLLWNGSYQKTKDPALSMFYHILQEPSMQVYPALAKAFNQSNVVDFERIVKENETLLHTQETYGLVMQVRRAIIPAAVRSLGDVYCRIAVPEALKQLQCTETELEAAVLYLAHNSGFSVYLETNAADVQEGRSLILGDATAHSSAMLENALDELVALNQTLEETHMRILVSTENIQADVKGQARSMFGGGSRGGMGFPDMMGMGGGMGDFARGRY